MLIPWEQIAQYATSAGVGTICFILLFNHLRNAARASLDNKVMQMQLINVQKLLFLDRVPSMGGDSHDESCEKCRRVAEQILSCFEEQKKFIEQVYRDESK